MFGINANLHSDLLIYSSLRSKNYLNGRNGRFILSFNKISINIHITKMDVAYQKFYTAIFKWNRKLLDAVGHDIYAEDFQLNWRSCILYLVLIFCEVFVIYTMIYYDGPTRVICIFYFSLCLQVCKTR